MDTKGGAIRNQTRNIDHDCYSLLLMNQIVHHIKKKKL